MENDHHIDQPATRWVWIESLTSPAAVLQLRDRSIAAVNAAASTLLGVPGPALAGAPASRLVPDYLLPSRESVSQWTEEALAGRGAGMSIDVLLQTSETPAFRVDAHLGPADNTGEFVLLTFQRPWSSGPGETTTATDDALLGLMSDIGHIVGSSLDVETVSQRFAISLMHVVPAEHVAILLMDRSRDSLGLIFSTGPGAKDVVFEPDRSSPIARAIDSNSALLLESHEIKALSTQGVTAWFNHGSTVLTACCVPLIASGNTVGVVLLGSAIANAFSVDDLMLLEHASSQVAGAIANVMLHEELAQSALERDVLANIGRLASAATDFAGAMSGIAAELNRFMPVTELCVYEPDDASGELERSYSWTESGQSPVFDADDSPDATAQRESAFNETGAVISAIKITGDGTMAAATTTALSFGGRTVGVLTAVSSASYTYTEQESVFVSMVAGQLAGAVHTARAYKNQQREAHLRRSLAQISVSASKDLSPDSVFERIATEVAELVEYRLFAIAVRTPDREHLNVRYHIGTDAARGVYSTVERNRSTDSFEWRERIIRPLPKSGQFARLASQGINSLIEVSLGIPETGATGYMLVGTNNEVAFTKRELRMLSQVAAQVTPAIQNATAHEQAVALAEARMAEAKAEARNIELEKINDAKSRFLSIVSHELRTPLTSIIAYAELLERNPNNTLTEKQVKQASVINKSATHLKFLISDLLDVSRIESGNLSLEMSTFQLGQVVRDVVEQLEPVVKEKSQDLDVHIADTSLEVRGDHSRIVQVVSNLIENASKYSEADTVITVSVHRRGPDAVITVADQGHGISEEDQKQLFRPFFRGNSELTRTEPGTGLGLALVKSIAQLHGGSVSVESKAGDGSTFSVTLKAWTGEQAA